MDFRNYLYPERKFYNLNEALKEYRTIIEVLKKYFDLKCEEKKYEIAAVCSNKIATVHISIIPVKSEYREKIFDISEKDRVKKEKYYLLKIVVENYQLL